jgi:trehalose/maltose hydrolase-like predicted phosphorylase
MPGLTNNAYTNIMAVWVLLRALEVLDLVRSKNPNVLCPQRLQLR